MASSGPASISDGRLLRSERSREAIVRAIYDLVGEGALRPTAEQVAARAGVGIRTVFRHFSDMENLFAEMDARLRAEVLPLLEVAAAGTLDERAQRLVRQRCAVFERIAPYKRADALLRWRSDFVRDRHRDMVRRLRTNLLDWLPELAEAPADLLEAADLALSFEAWNRLRCEQRLGRRRAAAAVERTLAALLCELSRPTRPGSR